MKLQRRRGMRQGAGGRDEGKPEGRASAGAALGRVSTRIRAGSLSGLLERNRRRLLISGGIVVVAFIIGNLLASAWLFPSADDPADMALVSVPDLADLTVGEATARLQSSGLGAEIVSEIRHPTAPAGRIIAQGPLSGQLARPGATVRLTASLGADARTVPDLAGVSARQATLVLQRLGFEVETRVVQSEGSQGGVLGSRPEPGETLTLPAKIELLVGEGPQVAVVPELRGRHVDDVAAVLDDTGLQLGAIEFDPFAAEAPGRVVRQSPPPGFSLRGGGFVSIVVAGDPGDSDLPIPSPQEAALDTLAGGR